MSTGIVAVDASALRRHLESEIKEAVEAELGKIIEEAQRRIDKAIRAHTGRAVLSLVSSYSIDTNGRELLIRVDIERRS